MMDEGVPQVLTAFGKANIGCFSKKNFSVKFFTFRAQSLYHIES